MAYTFLMKVHLAAYITPTLFLNSAHLLAASAVGGVFCLLFLFALVFVCVHILTCAKMGWRKGKKKPCDTAQENTAKEKAPAPPPEPIYYIVEKKRTRTKSKYGTPKEIRFK